MNQNVLQIISVGTFIISGFAIGKRAANWPKRYWLLGFCVPLAFIVMIGLQAHYPQLNFVFPFSLLGTSTLKRDALALATPILLLTPLDRSKQPRLQILGGVFLLSFLLQYCILPVTAPLMNQKELAQLNTTIDHDGVCRQQTGFTCRPAAAVTALRRLGLNAEEGELAVLARTTSFNGTPPDVLAETLQERYAPEGLHCEYRSFNSIDELRMAGLTLAVIKFNAWLDHYVTVLEITDEHVVAGDPLEGKVKYTRAEFEKTWRHSGVVMQRPGAQYRL